MRPFLKDFIQFLRVERGAITVEYVVLAAAVTGLSVALSDTLQAGMRTLTGTVESEFKGEPVSHQPGIGYSDGFDNGPGGWTGGSGLSTHDYGGVVGKALGPIAGSGGAVSVSRDFAIHDDATQATFEFDLLAMDSLDNESGIVFINGEEVGRITSNLGKSTFTAKDEADLRARGIILRATVVDDDMDLGGSDRWKDSSTSVRITVKRTDDDTPIGTVNVGIGSTADQGTADESIAIDNFVATGLADG